MRFSRRGMRAHNDRGRIRCDDDKAPADTAGLRERILQVVRDDLYRGPSTHLQTGRGNPFSISTAAVRSIVRIAVDSVDGIRARSVDVDPAGDPEGSAATVALTVAMRAAAKVLRRAGGEPTGVDVSRGGDGVKVRIDAHLDDTRSVAEVVDEIFAVIEADLTGGAIEADGPLDIDLRVVSRGR